MAKEKILSYRIKRAFYDGAKLNPRNSIVKFPEGNQPRGAVVVAKSEVKRLTDAEVQAESDAQNAFRKQLKEELRDEVRDEMQATIAAEVAAANAAALGADASVAATAPAKAVQK